MTLVIMIVIVMLIKVMMAKMSVIEVISKVTFTFNNTLICTVCYDSIKYKQLFDTIYK
jgi:hypothetical protein